MTPDEAERIRSQPGWWSKRRTLADALRCALGAHRTVLDGSDDGLLIERCSCGATRLGGRFWLREAWWSPPRAGWTDPAAEVRRREQEDRLVAQWWPVQERLRAKPCTCAHCGRRTDRPEGFVTRAGARVPLCRPALAPMGKPHQEPLDCYRLVTVYGEEIGARLAGSPPLATG